MSFVATDHPRGTAGRFIPTVHAEPALTLAPGPTLVMDSPAEIQARRLQAARDVLAEYGDLEIMDHSPARQHTVRLDELGDPLLALGNCWAATNEVIDQIGSAELGAEWLDEITLSRAGWAASISRSWPATGTGATASITPPASCTPTCRSRTWTASRNGKLLWSGPAGNTGVWMISAGAR